MPPKRAHKRPPKAAPKPTITDEPEAPRFNPDAFLRSWGPQSLPQHNGFRAAIEKAFDIEPTDDYIYQAHPAKFTLPQVQVAIDHGNMHGLHAWYRDDSGQQVRRYMSATLPYTSALNPTVAFRSFANDNMSNS
jgi:hypothetical protein